jgi:thioredoxin 1
MPSNIVNLNDSTVRDWVVDEPEATLVCVGAQWCTQTRELQPKLEELGTKYAGKVRLAMVDFDESPDFVRRHGVTAVPTMLAFKGTERIDDPFAVACDINKINSRPAALEELFQRMA